MQKGGDEKELRKPQQQPKPGIEEKMEPRPVAEKPKAAAKLQGRVALITGGDSGIGRAVAVLFAQEGAHIAISYLNEQEDAEETKRLVEKQGRKCLLLPGNIRKEETCRQIVEDTVKEYGRLNILVNNAATHYEQKNFEDISTEQLLETFETNIFSFFWVTKYALKHLKKGSSIVNTTSVTSYRGSSSLVDYASTKGAITSFTRSLSSNLVEKGIRVNAVAPGPIWTPLIVSTKEKDEVASFGSDVPMKRSGEPAEVATSFLFLAGDDASYITGQVLHPNGGEIVNG